MDSSKPGFPVLHHLLEFAQTHVHWVGDAIQPPHLLSLPSPPTFNLSQHRGLFQWIGSLNRVARILELQLHVTESATSNVEHIPCHLATWSYLSRDIKYFLSQSIWHSETYLSRLHILFLPRTTEGRARGPSDHLIWPPEACRQKPELFWDTLLLLLKTCSATTCVLPIKGVWQHPVWTS